GSFEGGDPATVANKLIGAAWDKKPEVFDGSFGGDRPHKISIALYALANAIEALSSDSTLRTYLIPPFVRLMSEIQQNEPLCSFNQVDHFIFEPCVAVYSRIEDEMGLSEGLDSL
ncbi:MAG: hypothetical protein Q8J65_03425, partial [Nitrosomonadales bacterium]|nr:hypothetical protein [Nitrosomonadales bacterium]